MFRAALAELQDVLGELNDLVVGPQLLARLGLDAPFPALAPDHRKNLLDRAEIAYDQLIDAKRFWR